MKRKISPEIFELIAEYTVDWELLVDKNGQICWTNKACKKITGYKCEEIVGNKQKFLSIFSSKYSLEFEKMMKEALKKKSSGHDIQSKIVTKNQKIVWISTSWQPVYSKNREFLGIRYSIREINKRVKEEAEVQRVKQQLEDSFQQSPIAIAHVGLDGKWLKVNQKVQDLFGMTEKELLNTNFQKLTHPDDLQEDLKLVKQTIDGKIDSYDMEKRYFHKNGDVIWGFLSVSLIKDKKGKPLHFVSQIQNITERKSLEERYNSLFETIDAGIAVYSVKKKGSGYSFTFVDFNKKAEEIEKIKREKLLNKEVIKVFPGVKKMGLLETFTKVYKTGETLHIQEAKYLLGKEERWRENYVYRLGSGEIVAVFRDISDTINAREELKEKVKELQTLNNFMVDREIKMIDLKKTIKELKSKK